MRMVILDATDKDAEVVTAFVRMLAQHQGSIYHIFSWRIFDALRYGALQAVIAYVNDAPVGVATYYWAFSTFECRQVLHLEDLIVDEDHRGEGVGTALMARLKNIGRERGACRIEWSVNKTDYDAMSFYGHHGMRVVDGWAQCQLELLDRSAGVIATAFDP